MNRSSISIIDIPGIRVGHATNTEAQTGCTVILCETGAVGGVDQRGGAPGTRETDALRPIHLVLEVHAVVLSGGSAFGLDAATGVVRYLEERGVGFNVGVAKVPIVPSAILFDLGIGRPDIRPDAQMGYQACLNATNNPPEQGNVGVGTGATVGKILGMGSAMKGGVGNAGYRLGNGVTIAAIVAVNPLGDVVDPASGRIIAGARNPFFEKDTVHPANRFVNALEVMQKNSFGSHQEFADGNNTVIGVVATNAKLSKEEINKVAQMAQDGIARAIRPAHTMLDGDTIFTLSMGKEKADVNAIGAFAAEAVSQAILNAIMNARSIIGMPSASIYS